MTDQRAVRRCALFVGALVLAAIACSPLAGIGGQQAGGDLGDYVWLDANGDGLQSDEEQGVGGVTVRLLDEGGAAVQETQTDQDGRYVFAEVAAGTYVIEFVRPDGTAFTLMDVGQDDSVDSDARQADGRTEPFDYAGESDLTRDAGLVSGLTPSTPPPATATAAPTATEPPAQVPPDVTSTYEHTSPGQYSEIVIQVDNLVPGDQVSGTVTGPAVDGDGSFTAEADEYGTAIARVRIFQFGDYVVEIPDLDYTETVQVTAADPPSS